MREDIRDYIRMGQLLPLGTLVEMPRTFGSELCHFLLVRYDVPLWCGAGTRCPTEHITVTFLNSHGDIRSWYVNFMYGETVLAKPPLDEWYGAAR